MEAEEFRIAALSKVEEEAYIRNRVIDALEGALSGFEEELDGRLRVTTNMASRLILSRFILTCILGFGLVVGVVGGTSWYIAQRMETLTTLERAVTRKQELASALDQKTLGLGLFQSEGRIFITYPVNDYTVSTSWRVDEKPVVGLLPR